MNFGDGRGFPATPGLGRMTVGIPDVFCWSIGDSIAPQPEMGWRGVVAINYREGWMDVDTRYRWTDVEHRAIAGVVARVWMWLGLR